jgi:hypothetical protein
VKLGYRVDQVDAQEDNKRQRMYIIFDSVVGAHQKRNNAQKPKNAQKRADLLKINMVK